MRPEKTFFVLALLGNLVACYSPPQASYSPAVSQQPQPLHPSSGYGLAASTPQPL